MRLTAHGLLVALCCARGVTEVRVRMEVLCASSVFRMVAGLVSEVSRAEAGGSEENAFSSLNNVLLFVVKGCGLVLLE